MGSPTNAPASTNRSNSTRRNPRRRTAGSVDTARLIATSVACSTLLPPSNARQPSHPLTWLDHPRTGISAGRRPTAGTFVLETTYAECDRAKFDCWIGTDWSVRTISTPGRSWADRWSPGSRSCGSRWS